MKKMMFFGLAFLLLANFTGCVCGPGYMPGFYNNSSYNGYAYNPHPNIPMGNEAVDCGGCGSCDDCGVSAPGICGPHQVSGCTSCFPVARAVARGVLWTPISAVHRLFNFGYYPYGGCGPMYLGECNKACSPCDAEGNFVGGPCGVGCSPNPAMDTCAVNYIGGPYNSRLCGGSSSIFSDKYVPGLADTQMHYQFRSEPCSPFFGFGWGYQQAPVQNCAPSRSYITEQMPTEEIYEEYEYIEEAPRTAPKPQADPNAKRAVAPNKNLVASSPQGNVVKPLTAAPKSNLAGNNSVRQVSARQIDTGSTANIRTAHGTQAVRKPSPEAVASLGEEELPPQKQVITTSGARKIRQ